MCYTRLHKCLLVMFGHSAKALIIFRGYSALIRAYYVSLHNQWILQVINESAHDKTYIKTCATTSTQYGKRSCVSQFG